MRQINDKLYFIFSIMGWFLFTLNYTVMGFVCQTKDAFLVNHLMTHFKKN